MDVQGPSEGPIMQYLQERVITCPECLADNSIVGDDQTPQTAIRCSHCGAQVGVWADTREGHTWLDHPAELPRLDRIVRADRPASAIMPANPTAQDRGEEIRVNNGLHDGQRYTNR